TRIVPAQGHVDDLRTRVDCPSDGLIGLLAGRTRLLRPVGAQPHRGGEDLRIGSDPGRACTDALPRDHTGDGGAVVDGRLPTDRGLTVLAESAEVLGLADHTLE